jgi:hypothetical protein
MEGIGVEQASGYLVGYGTVLTNCGLEATFTRVSGPDMPVQGRKKLRQKNLILMLFYIYN